MAARRPNSKNHRLEEAMALLINNQAAFVGQIARNDQERLALQRRSDEWQLKSDERWRKTEEWQRRSEERFARIEEWQRKSDERFTRIETEVQQLPQKVVQTVL